MQEQKKYNLADIVYWYRPSEVRDQGTGYRSIS